MIPPVALSLEVEFGVEEGREEGWVVCEVEREARWCFVEVVWLSCDFLSV